MMAPYWWCGQINIVCADVCQSLFSNKAALDKSRGNIHKISLQKMSLKNFIFQSVPHIFVPLHWSPALLSAFLCQLVNIKVEESKEHVALNVLGFI